MDFGVVRSAWELAAQSPVLRTPEERELSHIIDAFFAAARVTSLSEAERQLFGCRIVMAREACRKTGTPEDNRPLWEFSGLCIEAAVPLRVNY